MYNELQSTSVINDKTYINAQYGNNKLTILHVAVTNLDLDIIRILISKGATIDMQDFEKATPLYYSLNYTGSYDFKVTDCLVLNGTNVDSPMFEGDNLCTWCCYHGLLDAAKLFISKHANINAKNSDGKTPLHCLLIQARSSKEIKLSILKLLLLNNVNLEIKDNDNHYAIYFGENNDFKESVYWLKHPENSELIGDV